MVSQGLGFARQRVILEIIKKNWNTDAPEDVKLSINDVLFIIQEMIDYETKSKVDNKFDKYEIFKLFVKHILHRNLANFDSMLLLTSEKGCLTDDSKIMMPRDLKKYPEGVPIKELINKGPIKVYSFNKETKKLELKQSDGVEFVKKADVYKIELLTGQKIKATDDHPFLLMDGTYKKLKDLVWLDKIKEKKGACYNRYREGSVWKYTDRLRMIIPKPDENDYLKTNYGNLIDKKSHNNKKIEYRFILEQLRYDINNKIVHHKDGNHFNNNISNLKIMSQTEHVNNHMKKYFFKEQNEFCKNTGYSTTKKDKIKNGSEKFKTLVSEQRKQYFSKKENVEKYRELMKTNGKHTNMYRYGGVIKNIKYIGKEDVYDVVNVIDNHNFIANGFSVSNTGKSSSALLLAREWCKLIGIRFDPKRHIAYSNKDVMDKVDSLNKFEPLVCDEAVRFASSADWAKSESKELRRRLAEVRTKHLFFILAFPLKIYKMEKNYLECLDGDTLIKTESGDIKIKDLEGKQNFKVYSLNEKLNTLELKNAKHCIKTKTDYVYEITTESNTKILATKDHRFMTNNGWKHLHEMSIKDKIKLNDLSYTKIVSIECKDKRDVYDILDVEDNHNYIANNLVVHNSFVNYWCITGDTKIITRDKNGMIRNTPVKNLNKYNPEVLSYNVNTKEYEFKKYDKKIKTKKDAEVFQLELQNGLKIKCTEDHPFLTQRGWVRLKDLNNTYEILSYNNISIQYRIKFIKIKSITKLKEKEDVYDIVGVKDNHNFVANNMVVHNCDLFGRGLGAIYVKDKNPVNDPWRIKDFKNVGSYTEFTSLEKIEKKLSKHPNFWKVIRFPKPPKWLYDKYLQVRESNVYDDDIARDTLTTVDVHKSLLLLALQDVMMNDTTFSMNRIILHIKNQYDIPISKKHVQNLLMDAKQVVNKVREEKIS